MSCPYSEDQLAQLRAFVDLCKSQPQILHHPKLSFFKEYLTSLGVQLPSATFGPNFTACGDANNTPKEEEKPAPPAEEESEPESDVELDMQGVIEPDEIDESQHMGDPDKEPTDEERDLSDETRAAAMKAFSEQKFEEAIKLYTEAIQLNPQSALLFAKRGQIYLKLNKPNACIKDCTRALELNCDSAAGYKFRGRAYGLLGKFEESSHDLCESLKIDYDDQTNEWLTEVKPNAEKLRQHKLSVQRKHEEKEHRAKLRRAREAREAREAQAARAPPGMPFPPGMGPGAHSDFGNLFLDPEVMAAFQDPEVAAALQDVSSNPSNFVKYQNNPKIAAVIAKLQSKLGARPPGGAPGAAPKPADDDVGLD